MDRSWQAPTGLIFCDLSGYDFWPLTFFLRSPKVVAGRISFEIMLPQVIMDNGRYWSILRSTRLDSNEYQFTRRKCYKRYKRVTRCYSVSKDIVNTAVARAQRESGEQSREAAEI